MHMLCNMYQGSSNYSCWLITDDDDDGDVMMMMMMMTNNKTLILYNLIYNFFSFLF